MEDDEADESGSDKKHRVVMTVKRRVVVDVAAVLVTLGSEQQQNTSATSHAGTRIRWQPRCLQDAKACFSSQVIYIQ